MDEVVAERMSVRFPVESEAQFKTARTVVPPTAGPNRMPQLRQTGGETAMPNRTESSLPGDTPGAPAVTHRALCLICGRFANRETYRPTPAGVHVSVFSCERGHLWQSRWTGAA